MKRLSMFNNALCRACGEPAAEGLADRDGLWCEKHGRIRAAIVLEEAAFAVLRTYGREDFEDTIAAVREYKGQPEALRSWRLG